MADADSGGLAGLLERFKPAHRNSAASFVSQDSDTISRQASFAFGGSEHGFGRGSGEPSDGSNSLCIRVAVRCRPPTCHNVPTFDISAEGLGSDKVQLLKISATDASWEQLPAETRRLRTKEARTFRCNGFCDPDCTQEDIFDICLPIINHVLEGNNGTILCQGTKGSGKSHTMSGPPEEIGKPFNPSTAGIMQRVANRVFEYLKACDGVTIAEASYLHIASADGTQEQLADLLTDSNSKLEVKQDPLNSSSYFCENLCAVTVRSPANVFEAMNSGHQRAMRLSATDSSLASRSHRVFTLNIETLQSDGTSKRSKFMLVDLASFEGPHKMQALSSSEDEAKRRQVMGIARILSSLSAVANNASGSREPALALLLRDCVDGYSQALFITHIGPELENLDETFKSLAFAQQIMAVRNLVNANRMEQEPSSLLQMKKKHNEVIRILQDKVVESWDEEAEERKKIHQEMEDLGKRLLTKESAEKTLDDMRAEQNKNLDKMRHDMDKVLKQELEQMRLQSVKELNVLKESLLQNAERADIASRRAEEHEAQVRKMHDELLEAQRAQRASEEEARNLQIRLASAEERAKMLQARQEELRQERTDFEDERKGLRHHTEQQWQKLAAAEGEQQKFKAEAEVQRSELVRLNATRTEDADVFRKERETWRAREAELQKEIAEMHRSLDDFKRNSELQAMKFESQKRDTIHDLHSQLSGLQTEALRRAEQIKEVQKVVADLEVERIIIIQREDMIRKEAASEIKRYEDELEVTREREAELAHMLNEVQDSIIVKHSRGPDM